MGICYTVILKDDFDWGYVGSSKKDTINSFTEAFKKINKFKPSLEARWPHHLVFGVDKADPEYYKEMVLNHCDYAWVYNDMDSHKLDRLK